MAVGADFRALFEKAPALYLVVDPHFFVLAASDNYLRAIKMRREDLVGQHLFDVFHDDPHNLTGMHNLRSSLERAVRHRVPDAMDVQRYDVRGDSGEMEERYWSPVNTPILGADGEVKYVIHCVEDVTGFIHTDGADDPNAKMARLQRRRVALMANEIVSRSEDLATANRQLKTTNEELAARTSELNEMLQAMQTFTYSIAHDLRGPLRALMGFSSVMAQEYSAKLDETGKGYLRHIIDAAQRMDKLLNDLLAYGRLTHVEVTATPVAIDTAVTKVLEDLDSEIRKRQAVIQVQGRLPTVIANPALLHQVLLNLIDNALKFVAPDKTPRVNIKATQTNDHVRLSIIDNGIGIPSTHHAKIFDLFVRLHKPTVYSGTGIGLALVKKAMERMMGKVGVESVPGEGSTFWLDFRASPGAVL